MGYCFATGVDYPQGHGHQGVYSRRFTFMKRMVLCIFPLVKKRCYRSHFIVVVLLLRDMSNNRDVRCTHLTYSETNGYKKI